MQDQKLLILHERWFWGGGSGIIHSISAQKYGRYYAYGLTPLHFPSIIQDARPEIFDAPLTLIIRRWQRYCEYHSCP